MFEVPREVFILDAVDGFPDFAEDGVCIDLELGNVALGFEKIDDHAAPAYEWLVDLIDLETRDAGEGLRRSPIAAGEHILAVEFLDHALAVLAEIKGRFRSVGVPFEAEIAVLAAEFERLKLIAVRAWDVKFALIAAVEVVRDVLTGLTNAAIAPARCRILKNKLFAVVGFGSCLA